MPWPVTLKKLKSNSSMKTYNLLELTPKKDVLFIIGDWNAKVGSQETPGVTGKFGLGVQNEAGQKLIEFCQENALVIANTLFQQHKRRLYTWTSPDGRHWNQIDYILCSQRWKSSIQSAKTRPGADCGLDHELIIAKFIFNWRKWGKPLDHSSSAFQRYWLGHRFGLLWYWMVCLGNRDHSVVFETASMYCILDFCWLWWLLHFFEGILPTIVDIMVIWVKFTHSSPF